MVLKPGDMLNFGVDAIALVDEPAIERYFQAFNNQKPMCFQVSNEEQRIITGPLMIADLPIYRRDANGEYMAVFDAGTIKQIALKFFALGNNKNVNEMHDPTAKVPGVIMFESFLIDSSRGISTPKGFPAVADGSWFGSYYVANDDVWAKVKDGTFRGFSVEGFFEHVPDTPVSDETAALAIIDAVRG